MKSKDKVYEELLKILDNSKNKHGVTAIELEKYLNVKRSVISLYLNLLFKEGKVLKTNSRPVRYYIKKNDALEESVDNNSDVFKTAIGYDGSLKKQIEQCKSAVSYPPYGMPIIIRGESGVGKSFLASLIYKYSIEENLIKRDAKFVELNCADYANNPELLSSVLFGHVEGAFTGAVKTKKGLMDEADGGYLFLDEIHRLSFENQEKLFLFLDKGKFRRLGENDGWHTANVRFILATTEDVKKSLLETFYRRIPVRITIPNFEQRPLIEKVNLISSFYKEEGKILNRNIRLTNDVINILSSSIREGNIGMLKNYIKLSCANAYKNSKDDRCINIDVDNLPEELDINKTIEYIANKRDTFSIETDKQYNFKTNIGLVQFFEDYIKKNTFCCKKALNIDFINNMKIFVSKLRNKINLVCRFNTDNIRNGIFEEQTIMYIYIRLKNELGKMKKLYGIEFDFNIQNNLLSILVCSLYNLEENLWKIDMHNEVSLMRKYHFKALYISESLLFAFKEFQQDLSSMIYFLFSISILDVLDNNTKMQAIIVAHGDSTATSIASVANNICQQYIYEPFDMPITDSYLEIVNKVNNYIDDVDTTHGLILLVDMGSLESMYEPIKSHIQGELLIINNVTTIMAIDIGLKLSRGDNFQKILDSSKNNYQTEVRYYEGIAQGDNIIISCISGIGISRKLKEVFEKCLDNKLEVITMEYRTLKEIIKSKNMTGFKRTKLVITTNNINMPPLYCVNIEDILSNGGQETLTKALQDAISEESIKKLSEELIKFFSIEGIKSNLSFLNPDVVISEVEVVIKQLEEYYSISFENNLRLNLYMHISIMIERLMLEKNANEHEITIDDSQKEFINVFQDIFEKITKKYGVRLAVFEILLIYEVVAPDLVKLNS